MIRRALVIFLSAALTLGGAPAFADTDPRVRSGEVDGLRYEVLLPPGYDGDDRRHPVLYLFSPGGNQPEDADSCATCCSTW